jgi:Nif-specific regulatory protein
MTTDMSSETKRLHVEQEVLLRISQAAVRQHNVNALMNEVLDVLETEMGLLRATLTLRKPDTDVFVIEASRGLSDEEQKRGEYKLGEGITGKVAKTGKPVLVPDISQSAEFLDKTMARKKAKVAFLCAPIIHRGQVIGTMSMDRPLKEDAPLKQDLHFLVLLTGLLAEAVAEIREQMAERESLLAENRLLKKQLDERFHPGNIIGNCSSMKQIYEQISQVADSTATVMIRGESGTGKELVARAIHFSSLRKNSAFVCVNCAALPVNLIESELFGHEKGAFTGASQSRKGRFELANGGTLFLDEIGDIEPSVQVRLLRVLQERTIERVGGSETLPINVRVITATSRNLEQYIKDGKFREDLYYRINVFPIHLPPLRERRSDIMLLADHFVQKYNQMYKKNIKRISTSAINMMMAYHWPGNVRELENCVERAVLTSTDDVIHGFSLPPSLQTMEATNTPLTPPDGTSLETMMDSYQREIIIDALKKHRGNAAAAARHLKTSQRVLNYQIQRLGIDSSSYKQSAPSQSVTA